jgi:hypothetical protein
MFSGGFDSPVGKRRGFSQRGRQNQEGSASTTRRP